MRCVLGIGGTIVLVDGLKRPKLFFGALKNENVTGIGMVPAAWAILYKLTGNLIEKYADQLNYIEFGSAPMPLEDKKNLIEYLPSTRLCMHYGLTEASRAAFIEFHSQSENLSSIGQATPNVELVIFGPKGEVLLEDEEGELWVKGDVVFKEYLNNSELTEKSFRGEYFKTGDRASRSKEGYITLRGRESDMINVGGKKVSPIEIETLLKAFPNIKDCACVGVPDPLSGEVVKAFLVAHNEIVTDAELREVLLTKVEIYKLPQSFEWVNSLPYTSSGKIQRYLLRTPLFK